MRIGVLSDTHIPEVVKRLPSQIREAFDGVDLILHAGDIYAVAVLDELESLAPVLAAIGDDDYSEVERDQRTKERQVLTLEGFNLWLIHDRALHAPPSLRPYAIPDPRQDSISPDILVFGHTHRAVIERRDGVLLINPGSATLPNYVPVLGTVALLTLTSGGIDAQIVPLA